MKMLCLGLCISIFISAGVIIALLFFITYIIKQYVNIENQNEKNAEIIKNLNAIIEEIELQND